MNRQDTLIFLLVKNGQRVLNHYIINDYEEFTNRYKRRIQNIKDLLNSKNNITFILTRPNTEFCDISELNDVINSYF